MVRGDDEDGVHVPRLAACRLEEAAQRHVGVFDAFVYGVLCPHYASALWYWTVGEALRIFFRHPVGVVARCGKDGGDEWLAHLCHLLRIELQEGLVPYCPGAVEGFRAAVARVCLKLCPSVICLEAGGFCESLEAHAPVCRSVEECCGVAFCGE